MRHAIAQGLRPITAIQMVRFNTALHFGLERDMGSITPGRYADILITSDLVALPIEMVIAGGRSWPRTAVLPSTSRPTIYPDFAVGTVKLGKRLAASDFDARLTTENRRQTTATVRVIGVVEKSGPDESTERTLPVVDGLIQPDPAQGVSHLALVSATGRRAR